jgi:hypothetical protein
MVPPPADRGIGSLAELVERLNEAGCECTIEELVKEPRAGFGDDLDAVL